MNTYKTKDGLDYTIPGIGRTENGTITTEATIENPNFELQSGTAEPVAAVEAPVQEPVATETETTTNGEIM